MNRNHWWTSGYRPQGARTASGAIDLIPVVLSGSEAAGTGGRPFVSILGSPAINNQGLVVFMGALTSGIAATGVWAQQANNQFLLAQVGDILPGLSSPIAGFNVPGAGDGVSCCFFMGLQSGDNGGALCLIPELLTVAMTGQTAPGTSGTYQNTFPTAPSFGYPIAINASSTFAFMSEVTGAGAVTGGVWIGPVGQPSVEVLTGYPAPGTGLSFTGFNQVHLNDNGVMAFAATTEDGGGVWAGASGSLILIALSGQDAPGSGQQFFQFDAPTLNNAGVVAFEAMLTGGLDSIWSYDGACPWSRSPARRSRMARA